METQKSSLKEDLREIYRVEAEKYSKTRDIQWRLNIATWSLIAIAIAYNDKLPLGINLHVGIYLFLGMHCVFLLQIQRSLDNSLSRLDKIATALIGNEMWSNFAKRTHSTPSWLWVAMQAAITALLMAFFYLTLEKRPDEPIKAISSLQCDATETITKPHGIMTPENSIYKKQWLDTRQCSISVW